jgi:hypothetical protein
MQDDNQMKYGGVDPSRRKLFRGVSGGAGVLLAVQAKTALGGIVCQSPSAMLSGNTSPRTGSGKPCVGGRSPGYWKVPQHFSSWINAIPATVTGLQICASGLQGVKYSDITDHKTLLSSLFTGAPSGVGLWAALAFPNDTNVNVNGNGQLLRHLTAAYLNSQVGNWSNGGAYPITVAQIKAIWIATNGGVGCYVPGSTSTSCTGAGMNRAGVISYIEGLYDIDAGIDPQLCVP